MKPENGGHPYFCTEQVFQETYIDSGRNLPVNEDDFNEYIHQGS